SGTLARMRRREPPATSPVRQPAGSSRAEPAPDPGRDLRAPRAGVVSGRSRAGRGAVGRVLPPATSLLPRARAAPLARFVAAAPELATLVPGRPEGDECAHEMKFDGYRILARIEGGAARLLSRNDKDWTDRFGVVARAASQLPVRDALLDGEVAVVQPDGTTS